MANPKSEQCRKRKREKKQLTLPFTCFCSLSPPISARNTFLSAAKRGKIPPIPEGPSKMERKWPCYRHSTRKNNKSQRRAPWQNNLRSLPCLNDDAFVIRQTMRGKQGEPFDERKYRQFFLASLSPTVSKYMGPILAWVLDKNLGQWGLV